MTRKQKQLMGLIALILSGLAVLLASIAPVKAESGAGGRNYVPLISGGQVRCDIPGARYEALSVDGRSLTIDPAKDANLNLAVRGFARTNAPLTLVSYGPVTDRRAPQFPSMFADNRVPAIVSTYHRYRWSSDCNCPVDTYSPWPATVLGLRTQPNEIIAAPDSGYDVGGGYEHLVLYAGETGITLHIGRKDGLDGYVTHIEGICVEPNLLALYNRLHANGRRDLPVLRGRQPLGRAIGNEIQVAIRDNGHFLDPRSRNDWWQGR